MSLQIKADFSKIKLQRTIWKHSTCFCFSPTPDVQVTPSKILWALPGESFKPKSKESKITVRGANSCCRMRTIHIFSSWSGEKGTQPTWSSDSQFLPCCGQDHSSTLSDHWASLHVSHDHETFVLCHHHWNVSLFRASYK